MKNLYCCYSLNLRNYLSQNGVEYELCANNPNNNRRFWIYMRSEKLDELIKNTKDLKLDERQ